LFAELLIATISFVNSVRMHQLANSERIFVKFGTGAFIKCQEIIRLSKIG